MVLRLAAIAVLAAAASAAAQIEPVSAPGLESEIFEFDAVLQADLDALLADPVVLDAHADLDRLQVLPWMDAAALASLSAALPVDDLSALALVPPWDAARVRRLVPFVQAAPSAGAAPRSGWRVVTDARPEQMDVRVEHGTLRAVARQPGHGALAIRGALQWSGSRGGFTAGGLRAAQGLGLVMGPHAWGTDASAAIQPVAAPAQRSMARTPWLQGVALYTARGGLALYGGRGAAGALQALSVGNPHVRGAVVRAGSAWRAGGFLQMGDGADWAAVEIARGPEGFAGAVAAQSRAGNIEIASRLDARPDAWGDGGGAGPAGNAAAAQGRARWRNGRTALSAQAARGWRSGAGDLRNTTSALALDMSLRAAGWVFDALWTRRESGTEEVDGAGAVETARCRESWGVRSTRAGARGRFGCDLRRWRDTAKDQAWQVHWSAGPVRRRLGLALAGFTASHSRALGLPVSGIGADSRLQGRGMRLAAGVSGVLHGFEVRALAAGRASAERGWELQAHAAAALRWP